MKDIIVTGKTVEEAIEKAVKDLGVKRDNMDIEVLVEPKQGFLGIIGAKEANVKVRVKYQPEEYIIKFLQDVIELMGLKGAIKVKKRDKDSIFLLVAGENMGILIGKRGQTLNALQYITNVAMHRQFQNERLRLILDIGDYRQRREKVLKQLAFNLAQKALNTQKNIVLEPMPPQERRIIHLTLSKNNGVKTFSQGEEPNRKVIITPNN